ncbi:MAG: hypothetical protein ACRDCB_08330 [Clostridium sp.]|uniref:hypothetical protein n=1 Tax=Clostridium chrysemydis TaxID=2665504 RepID=UPI003EE603B5
MSVCIALLPVALVLRVSLGKEGFEKFCRLGTKRIYTNVQSIDEMQSYIRRAGYDANIMSTIIKTHISGFKYDFLLWKTDEYGNMCIDLAKSRMNRQVVINHLSRVEQAAGRMIFVEHNEEEENLEFTKSFETQFTDKEMLIKTLESYNLPMQVEGDDISVRVEDYDLLYEKEVDGYNLTINYENEGDLDKLYSQILEFDGEYKKNVQGKVYENLVEKIKETNMEIESEDFLEDNSVVLTLTVD